MCHLVLSSCGLTYGQVPYLWLPSTLPFCLLGIGSFLSFWETAPIFMVGQFIPGLKY